MKFIKYPSITNSFKGDAIDYIKLSHADDLARVSWHIYEKVHGANFSMWYDGKEFRYAKRSGFLNGENFFNSNKIIEKYQLKLDMAYKLAKHPIVIYGELFGGYYDGKSAGVKMVQKEVQYCPDVDFLCFDIAYINNNDTLEYATEADFHDLAFASGMPIAPYMGEFKDLDTALKENNKFVTTVPNRYALPTLVNNWCEGIVIKPSEPLWMYSGERIIFKNKNELFKESKSVEVDSSMSSEFIKFFNELRSHITEERLRSVVSKLGYDQQGYIYFNEFLKDCLDQCPKVEYNTYSNVQKRLLNKLCARSIWPLIKDVVYKTKAA